MHENKHVIHDNLINYLFNQNVVVLILYISITVLYKIIIRGYTFIWHMILVMAPVLNRIGATIFLFYLKEYIKTVNLL